MKIIVLGGNGTIGTYVVNQLKEEGHEVVTVGRSSGDFQANLEDTASLEKLFSEVKDVDAAISIAGTAKWAPLQDISEEDYYIGIKSKLMGQVNFARLAIKNIKEGGAIILSTGILADRPVPMTASAAMVNGGIHSFVKAAAIDATNVRISAVSLGLVEPSAKKYDGYFPGHTPIKIEDAVATYLKAVNTDKSGEVFTCY